MSLENLPAGANITIGAGAVLGLLVGAILRGVLIPAGVYNRLLLDLDKKDAEISRLITIQSKQADSIERFSRRNNKARE